MVTMDRIDRMMKEAQQEQAQEQDIDDLQNAETLPITGVQLNASSRMVTIYQRETGEPRQLPALSAQAALRKKYRNGPLAGNRVFSITPTKKYQGGQVKCMLHPSGPQRAQFDTWGLPVCKSEHLASPGDMQRHMALRHKSAWSVIQKADDERKHQEQIDAQTALGKAILEATKGTARPEAPLYVKEPKKK